MSISAYGLLAFLLIMIGTVSGFASYAGFTVKGVPIGGEAISSTGLLGLVEWAWNSLVFLFTMSTFQVDDMPILLSGIFLIMELLAVFLIIRTIRGN